MNQENDNGTAQPIYCSGKQKHAKQITLGSLLSLKKKKRTKKTCEMHSNS